MAEKTSIEWTDSSWTPIRARWVEPTGDGGGRFRVGWHCERVSDGCRNCYAEAINLRLGTGLKFKPGNRRRNVVIGGPRVDQEWRGDSETHELRGDADLFLDERMLLAPLRWKKPRMIFVCSMTDLFADFVPDAWIDRLFSVMALAPQHTFQLLSKRSKRMRKYVNDPLTPHRVARAMDALGSKRSSIGDDEQVAQIDGFPGYFVTDLGRVLTETGSSTCVHCGGKISTKTAKSRYCSPRCRSNGQYRLRIGKPMLFPATPAEMSPDIGEDKHARVMLYRDGETTRELVHRLVLTAFDRAPIGDEQGRHGDGDPSNNRLTNLSWGEQTRNWDDSKRHGTHRRHSKLTQDEASAIRERHASGETGEALAREYGVSATQIRNIAAGRQWNIKPPISWPLVNCWLGVSAENQPAADERIPDLLATPAAVRFVSAEPLLGGIDFSEIGKTDYEWTDALDGQRWVMDEGSGDVLYPSVAGCLPPLDWIIVGGESGRGARPMQVEWARSIVEQCRSASVACFVKQLGADPIWSDGAFLNLRNRKGADKAEWPVDLCVQEFPNA